MSKGWFDEQIRQRKQQDDEVFADFFASIAGSVLGQKLAAALSNDRLQTKNAIDEILKYYHLKSRELPESITDVNEQLEYLMRPHGIMYRTVTLEKGWYRDAVGAMLGTRTDNGSVVALLPAGLAGYCFFDLQSGQKIHLSRKTAVLIAAEAICFYQPLPQQQLGLSDLFKYIIQTLTTADLVLLGLATLAVTLVGLLGPLLNNIVFSEVLPASSLKLLLAVTIFMVSVTLSLIMLNSVKALLMARINTKMSLAVQAASMMRLLSLPPEFFKDFSSGELATRCQYINTVCSMLVSAVLSAGLTSVFSLLYISQIFVYAPALVLPALGIILTTVLFSLLSALLQMRISQQQMELNARQSGMSYALISGIQKIKLAGAEKRVFARWGQIYAKEAQLLYNPPLFIKLNGVIATAITLTGTIIMYYAAVRSQVSVADYYAFNAAYGLVAGAFMSLSSIALMAARIRPILIMIKPILRAVPEVSAGKQHITKLKGGIELSNVSFRYADSLPLVTDNLSLKIRPGQYVAVVGPTGCGKSTLLRLLLGFETPQKGAVYYDGHDLTTIDIQSLRRKIGVVMQNGKLFAGDIFSNITVAAPWLTLDEAWAAAELAGIADDIRQMPMGMHTMLSEGGGGISGGQRQRLMIARAVAPQPRIILLDEATSALDNLTQKKISDALAKLHCTRIVIAHRLSTIRQCDRIIVLDQGKIVEDGNYDTLLAQNGLFAELAARQRLDLS